MRKFICTALAATAVVLAASLPARAETGATFVMGLVTGVPFGGSMGMVGAQMHHANEQAVHEEQRQASMREAMAADTMDDATIRKWAIAGLVFAFLFGLGIRLIG